MIPLGEICFMQIEELYKIYRQRPFIKIDNRKIEKGDLFFALKGPNFNANHFAMQALDAGAAYSIIDEENVHDERLIKTENVLQTLQQLAKHHRQQFNIPFIAITGSNGKTTTKELINEVLSASFKTYTTEGNLNNHIGVPLTILKIRDDAEMAVIEMGANHLKEIESYCEYTLPTHGLITNCGKAHLEGFGSIEGVRKAKGELFDFVKKNGGTAFINNDDEVLKNMSIGIKEIITYGAANAFVTGSAVNSSSLLEVKITTPPAIGIIKTKLIGEYNLPNVLAAVAVGKYFNVPDEKIKAAIENYNPTNSRSQLILKDSNKIILDAYNANPSSMRAAIINFAKMEGDEKVLMLGSMMELGNDSKDEHQSIIKLIDEYKWKAVALVGANFKNADHNYINFDSANEAAEWFGQQTFVNTNILIKGSRAAKMETVLEAK